MNAKRARVPGPFELEVEGADPQVVAGRPRLTEGQLEVGLSVDGERGAHRVERRPGAQDVGQGQGVEVHRGLQEPGVQEGKAAGQKRFLADAGLEGRLIPLREGLEGHGGEATAAEGGIGEGEPDATAGRLE